MSVSFWAFALLIAALIVFIISTRQWPIGQRTLIWGAGAALLAASFVLTMKLGSQDGFVRSVLEAAQHGKNSLLFEVVEGNQKFVSGYLAPMLDILLAFGAIAALFALVAFTPGEEVEAVTRPLCIMALGAAAGGLIALTVVSFGFGGYPKRQVFFSLLHADDVVDGDTIRMGDLSLRLAGIDAPEFDGAQSTDDQICFKDKAPVRCGEDARNFLVKLVENQIVVCGRPDKDPRSRDLYGRPLVTCTARVTEQEWPGLARELALAGLATALETHGVVDTTYREEIDDAAKNGRGIWSTCLLKPSVWRTNSIAKQKFLESKGTVWDEADVVPGAKCAHK